MIPQRRKFLIFYAIRYYLSLSPDLAAPGKSDINRFLFPFLFHTVSPVTRVKEIENAGQRREKKNNQSNCIYNRARHSRAQVIYSLLGCCCILIHSRQVLCINVTHVLYVYLDLFFFLAPHVGIRTPSLYSSTEFVCARGYPPGFHFLGPTPVVFYYSRKGHHHRPNFSLFLLSSSPLECLTVGSCWTVFTPHEMLMAQKSE